MRKAFSMLMPSPNRGSTLSTILGLPNDTGQLPGREPWDVNPPIAAGQGVNPPEPRADLRQTGEAGDYSAILRDALGPRPSMSSGQKIAAVLGPALMAASGNETLAMHMAGNVGADGREWDDRNRDAQLAAITWRRDDDRAAAERNKPQFLSGASDQVRYDPVTGAATRIYDAPEDFETYAATQGLEPGTEGYFRAVEDYVLRGNGPTAFRYDKDLETVRNAGRMSLEEARQRNRVGLESDRQANRVSLRQTPSARRPAASKTSEIVTVKTPAEAAKLPKGTKFRGPDGKVRIRP